MMMSIVPSDMALPHRRPPVQTAAASGNKAYSEAMVPPKEPASTYFGCSFNAAELMQ